MNIDELDFEGSEEEIMAQMRTTIKLAVKALEIYWEELKKAKLPKELKQHILINMAYKEKQN